MYYFFNPISGEIIRSSSETAVAVPWLLKGFHTELNQYPLEVLTCDNPPTGDIMFDAGLHAAYTAVENAAEILRLKAAKVRSLDSIFEKKISLLTVELVDVNTPYPPSEQKTFTTKEQEAESWVLLTSPQKTAELSAYPLTTLYPTILGEALTSQGLLTTTGVDNLANIIITKAHLYKYKAGEVVGHRRSFIDQIAAVTETDPVLYQAAMDAIDITSGWPI